MGLNAKLFSGYPFMLTKQRVLAAYFLGVAGLLFIDLALFLFFQDSFFYHWTVIECLFFGAVLLGLGALCILLPDLEPLPPKSDQ